MKRNQWLFKYTREAVTEALRLKVIHHSERLRHWEDERDARKKKLQEEGIKVEDHVRPGVANRTAYQGMPTLDNELNKHYADAIERVQFHTDCLDNFRRFGEALPHAVADENDELELHIEDVEFFGL